MNGSEDTVAVKKERDVLVDAHGSEALYRYGWIGRGVRPCSIEVGLKLDHANREVIASEVHRGTSRGLRRGECAGESSIGGWSKDKAIVIELSEVRADIIEADRCRAAGDLVESGLRVDRGRSRKMRGIRGVWASGRGDKTDAGDLGRCERI